MSEDFSAMVKQFIANGNTYAIPNPSRPGYLCKPTGFLSELIRFLSMMQVLNVGIGNEIAGIKNDLKIANRSSIPTKSDDRLYNTIKNAIQGMSIICFKEGETAYISGETELAEAYAWTIAGCKLFLKNMHSIE